MCLTVFFFTFVEHLTKLFIKVTSSFLKKSDNQLRSVAFLLYFCIYGHVGDISKNAAQIELSTIETITDMRVDWNKVMQAMMQKMKDTGELVAETA